MNLWGMHTAVLVLILAATPVAGEPVKKGSIEELSWLAGCWQGVGSGPRVDEQWMAPLGGLMLGMGRTVKGAVATQFEQMRIQDKDGVLVFTSKPSGQEEASFSAIESGPSGVVFENKTHDFPQRIIYRLNDDGSLTARIEGEQSGKVSGIDFPMRRESCPGSR